MIAAHMRALRRAAKGDVLVQTHRGVTAIPVVPVGGVGVYARVAAISAPAFSVLRDEGLVTWTATDDSYGPWPLTLTDKGRETLEGVI